MKKFTKHFDDNNGQIVIDTWYEYNPNIKNFRYYLPVCCQKFPSTENQKNWNSIPFMQVFIKVLNMDKIIQPGWNIGYFWPYIIITIIVLKVLSMYTVESNGSSR